MPKRKVEEMDADIAVLKTAVKMLAQEVAELKKARQQKTSPGFGGGKKDANYQTFVPA